MADTTETVTTDQYVLQREYPNGWRDLGHSEFRIDQHIAAREALDKLMKDNRDVKGFHARLLRRKTTVVTTVDEKVEFDPKYVNENHP